MSMSDKMYRYLFWFMAVCNLFNFFIKPFLPWFQ